MAMTRRLWSISAISVELKRDRRTIADALRDVPADGQIDKRTKGWWLTTILDAMAPAKREASDGDGLDLTAEKARLAKEQADAQEMKNAQLRRELLARADVDAAVTGAFARVRARMLALPGRLAAAAAAMAEPAEVEAAIRDAVHEALAELAATDVAALCGDDGELVDDPSPAASPDGERMGGSRAAAEP